MGGVNPQGCHVVSFKQPSSEERDHDYLWRHQNDKDIWKRRLRHLRDWEEHLVENGTLACDTRGQEVVHATRGFGGNQAKTRINESSLPDVNARAR